MLLPKRVKYRRVHRGRLTGKALRGNQVTVVKPGRVMFEIAGVPEETAREAMRLAANKLPIKCKIVSKADTAAGGAGVLSETDGEQA